MGVWLSLGYWSVEWVGPTPPSYYSENDDEPPCAHLDAKLMPSGLLLIRKKDEPWRVDAHPPHTWHHFVHYDFEMEDRDVTEQL